MSANAKVYLRQTASKSGLVVCVDNTIWFTVRTAYILIEAVADVGSLLSSMIVKVFLSACNAFIYPAVELTNFFTNLGDVSA